MCRRIPRWLPARRLRRGTVPELVPYVEYYENDEDDDDGRVCPMEEWAQRVPVLAQLHADLRQHGGPDRGAHEGEHDEAPEGQPREPAGQRDYRADPGQEAAARHDRVLIAIEQPLGLVQILFGDQDELAIPSDEPANHALLA